MQGKNTYKRIILGALIWLLGMEMLFAQVSVQRLSYAAASFRQTKVSAMLAQPEVKTGTFCYMAPDSVRWQYSGKANTRMPEQMLQLIRQSVGGDISQLSGTFAIEWTGKELKLTPIKKQIKRLFTSIRITFTEDGVAKCVRLVEANGDSTEIEFTNMKYTRL